MTCYDVTVNKKQAPKKQRTGILYGGKIMALTSRKNQAVKAIQAIMAREKKNNEQVKLEWEMACNTNNTRGHVYDQSEINALYDRDDYHAGQGATKTCHLKNHYGDEFKFIVVKRHQTGGYIPEIRNKFGTGNQLVDEINCWIRYQEKEEADYLCPILKYFTSKSDKVTATSEKMQENVCIIAQKAIYVDDCAGACSHAEYLNAMEGYEGTDANMRYEELKRFATSQNWRDVMRNPGNSGVIFDYSRNCYKAVFIDYAL